MENTFVFLIEKEEIWARMLVQVLEDNEIPCATRSVFGVGFTMKTGTQDYLQVFVPSEKLEGAKELADELFSDENALMDEFCEEDEE